MNRDVYPTIASVNVGDELEPVSIPVTLQRLVMEAGANRDFSLIHHDADVAQATGAPNAYMNTFFIAGMIERLLREWMGPRGHIRSIKNLRMSRFNCVGDTAIFNGGVTNVVLESREVTVALECATNNGTTVTASAVVVLPGD